MMTVDDIITTAFETVQYEMLKFGGKKVKWTDPYMQELEASGHIHYLFLDELLDLLGSNGVSDIKRVSIPMSWTKKDEIDNPQENQKIVLVKNLCENVIYAHDDLFSYKYGKEICKLLIAKDYFRLLGAGTEHANTNLKTRRLHTLYAEVAPM